MEERVVAAAAAVAGGGREDTMTVIVAFCLSLKLLESPARGAGVVVVVD